MKKKDRIKLRKELGLPRDAVVLDIDYKHNPNAFAENMESLREAGVSSEKLWEIKFKTSMIMASIVANHSVTQSTKYYEEWAGYPMNMDISTDINLLNIEYPDFINLFTISQSFNLPGFLESMQLDHSLNSFKNLFPDFYFEKYSEDDVSVGEFMYYHCNELNKVFDWSKKLPE